MIDRFGEAELIQLTDLDLLAVQAPKAQRALDDAQALADGYVGRVYRLPLVGCAKPAPVPGDVGAVQMVAPEHEVYLRYKAAERELAAIADGKAVLSCPWGGTPGTLVAGDAPGDAEVFHSFSPRQITDDSLRGFA